MHLPSDHSLVYMSETLVYMMQYDRGNMSQHSGNDLVWGFSFSIRKLSWYNNITIALDTKPSCTILSPTLKAVLCSKFRWLTAQLLTLWQSTATMKKRYQDPWDANLMSFQVHSCPRSVDKWGMAHHNCWNRISYPSIPFKWLHVTWHGFICYWSMHTISWSVHS